MSVRWFEKLKQARVALLVAAGLVCSAPSQAVIWVGAWDPAFGAAFPQLGWRGEAKFFVPDACVAESGWVFNFESCSGGEMKVLSAEVEFYKLQDPDQPAVPGNLALQRSDVVCAGHADRRWPAYGPVCAPSTTSCLRRCTIAGGPYTDFVLLFEDDIARMGFISDPPDGPKTKGISDEVRQMAARSSLSAWCRSPVALRLLALAIAGDRFLLRRKSDIVSSTRSCLARLGRHHSGLVSTSRALRMASSTSHDSPSRHASSGNSVTALR